jgi:hypothetical protein
MPARLRDLKRVLGDFGIELTKPKAGSHWKATDGKRLYPIPSHAGLKGEIQDVYIRGVCRAFGLDYAELKQRL